MTIQDNFLICFLRFSLFLNYFGILQETETVFIEQVHVPSEPISSQSAQVPEFHNDFPVNRSLPPSTHNVDTLRNPHMGESDKLELRRKAVEEQFHRLQGESSCRFLNTLRKPYFIVIERHASTFG